MRRAISEGKRPFCVFEPPLGVLGATYDDHLRLVGKRVGDFLLVSIELFSLGRTAEALRAIIGSKSLARAECLTLTLSLGWSSANIAINGISLKIRFPDLHFRCRKYSCIFNHFYVIRSESYRIRWNYTAVRAITPFKVIQGHRVWYQSKAHMQLPISD